MEVKIILDKYPPYLSPNKFYEIKGQSQINTNSYFIESDWGSTTTVDISQIKFLEEIRNEKLDELLKL